LISLFPDQDIVVTRLRVALRSSSAVLVFAPTGFGKTVLAAALIKKIFEAKKRVIFCVHRVDLIVQTAKTFEKFGIPFSYIAAGHHYNPMHRVYIASIATLKNRLGKIPAHYVMVDEAHLSIATGWAKVANHYKTEGARLIGLTGTPERLDGKPLGDVWDVMVMGPSVAWLINAGRLSRYRAFAPEVLDISQLHSRDGDYVKSEVDDLMAGKAMLSGAVKHWQRLASGKRTIAFAPSVKRAQDLAAQFRERGIVAVALDGETPGPDRKAAFIGFADRQIDLIVNCSLFCEGFDLSAQVDRDVPIEAVLQYSPTQSLSKHLQQLGRGLRKKDEPAILIDLVGNMARLGLPDEDRDWSLEGRKKGEKLTDMMLCPECFAAHPPAKECPDCGFTYPIKKARIMGGRSIEEIDGEVHEIDQEAFKRQRKAMHDQEARDLADQIMSAKSVDDMDADDSIKHQLKVLLNSVTARRSQSPEKWAAHVITSRLQKLREKQGANK